MRAKDSTTRDVTGTDARSYLRTDGYAVCDGASPPGARWCMSVVSPIAGASSSKRSGHSARQSRKVSGSKGYEF